MLDAPPSIIDLACDPLLLGDEFSGASWSTWRTILRGAYALPMTTDEIALFRELTDRSPPTKQVRELWVIGGRRGGKDTIASLVAVFASLRDYGKQLRRGERAVVMCLATDRQQAQIVLRFIIAHFDNPVLRPLVVRETRDGLELSNGVDIVVTTSDYRSVRGRTIACVIFDEVAFWPQTENSSSPDTEIYKAVVPGMITLYPHSILVGITTPYGRRGLAYQKWQDCFGKDDEDVLVVKAASRVLNPTLPLALIEKELELDPEAASAEWLAEWRNDLRNYVDREALDAVTFSQRFELPPQPGIAYAGFIDASGGGSGGDSFALAIAHADGTTGVLDAVREWKPPYSPAAVVAEASALMKTYRIGSAQSDKWGAGFVRELFEQHNITCDQSAEPKSAIYLEFLPIINSHRCELLDLPKLRQQLLGLERRVPRGGHESVDHGPGGRDDVANAVAGVLVLVTRGRDPVEVRLALTTPEGQWRAAKLFGGF
jgi:hypothetical protein